jgi:hypothetical protein
VNDKCVNWNACGEDVCELFNESCVNDKCVPWNQCGDVICGVNEYCLHDKCINWNQCGDVMCKDDERCLIDKCVPVIPLTGDPTEVIDPTQVGKFNNEKPTSAPTNNGDNSAKEGDNNQKPESPNITPVPGGNDNKPPATVNVDRKPKPTPK